MNVRINGNTVGKDTPCFIVAEIGINHNGSLDIAKKLIDVAVDAGCDAVKFQKRDVPTVYTPAELAAPRAVDRSFIEHAMDRMRADNGRHPVLSSEAMARLALDPTKTTNGDLKYALEFGFYEFNLLDIYCREKGIMWSASAWDGYSAHFINGFDVPFLKIASACLTHTDLLRRVRYKGKPVVLSTGGSTMDQVRKAVDVLGTEDLILLHCVATYPCKDEDLNLGVIDTLKAEFPGVPVGYSGHEQGPEPTLVAVALGACMVERHITLDRSMPGSDQKASLEPHELKDLVHNIRRLDEGRVGIDTFVSDNHMKVLLGDGVKRVIPAEAEVMKKLRRVTDF